jgi:Helix-turn-helix domain
MISPKKFGTRSKREGAHPTASSYLEMQEPDPSWLPLRHAPFQYQANPNPLQGSKLSPAQIDNFVRLNTRNSEIIECTIDRDAMCFAVSFSSGNTENEAELEHEYFAPYEVRRKSELISGEIQEGREQLVAQVETVWTKMEERLRSAVRRGQCRIFARCDQPHARQFTQISSDAFTLFEITDWQNGIATNRNQDWLYAIHVAPPQTAPNATADPLPKARANLSRLKKPEVAIIPAEDEVMPLKREIPATRDVVFSVKSAAAYAKMGRSTLYNYIGSGQLIARKSGAHTIILKQELDSFLESLPMMKPMV